jgi:predicted nucleic acid-binding protein
VTADTSAVIAALSAWHDRHDVAARALAKVTALPAHVLLEAYSVLTRLPSGLAIEPRTASRVLQERFGAPALRLDARQRASLLTTLADAGVLGGSAYDGLVALEARAHGETLLTLDERALVTYGRLGVAVHPLDA